MSPHDLKRTRTFFVKTLQCFAFGIIFVVVIPVALRAQPINGWDAGDGMAPWRSPERAPEYGGNDNSPRKSDMFVKSASFTGDPTKARNSPWGESG